MLRSYQTGSAGISVAQIVQLSAMDPPRHPSHGFPALLKGTGFIYSVHQRPPSARVSAEGCIHLLEKKSELRFNSCLSVFTKKNLWPSYVRCSLSYHSMAANKYLLKVIKIRIKAQDRTSGSIFGF